MDIQDRKLTALNVIVMLGIQLLALALVAGLTLGEAEPSLAQSSMLANSVLQEVYSQGPERSTVSAQKEPTSPEQSNLDKSIIKQKWKLYVNDTYQYKFYHPPLAELETSKPEEVKLLFVEPFKIGVDEGTSRFGIAFVVHENPERLTVTPLHARTLGDSQEALR